MTDKLFVLVFKDGTRHDIEAKEHIGAISRYILEGKIPAREVQNISHVEELLKSEQSNVTRWHLINITDQDRLLVRDVLIEYLLRK